MAAYVPPGWPAGVHPPGSEDFERTAQAWLLDTVPPDYRLHGVLRRYPLALAAMATYHTKACVAGAREGYRTARTELGDALPPHALEAVLAAYRAEGRRLVATAQAVDLVARALRGEVFTPQLQETSAPNARRGPPGAGPGAGAAPGGRRPGTSPGAAGPGTERQADATREPAHPGTDGQPGASATAAGTGTTGDQLSARRKAASNSAESPAERPARDGSAKAKKAPAAQRPARNGGATRRKARPSDKQAAAG